MKQLQDSAAFFFAFAVTVLSVVSILGVWDFFNRDVITKSFETLGLLAFVAIIIMVAGKFIERHAGAAVPELPNPAFASIRHITLIVIIVADGGFVPIGVFGIWKGIVENTILYKSISSLAIFVFGAFIINMTCLARSSYLKRKLVEKDGVSVG
ncbi:MAG: hypothetical protein ACREGH_01925 [Minisyncoccia bacterium]